MPHDPRVRTIHTIQRDFDEHVLMDLPGRLLNHSCHANIGLVDNDMGAFDFYALRDIAAGDEFTIDYRFVLFYIYIYIYSRDISNNKKIIYKQYC